MTRQGAARCGALLLFVPAPSAAKSMDEMLARSRAVVAEPGCGASASADEIVVCAPRKDELDAYTLPPQRLVEPALPPAEFGLFGDVRAAVRGDQVGRGDGMPDRRVMVTVMIPF